MASGVHSIDGEREVFSPKALSDQKCNNGSKKYSKLRDVIYEKIEWQIDLYGLMKSKVN